MSASALSTMNHERSQSKSFATKAQWADIFTPNAQLYVWPDDCHYWVDARVVSYADGLLTVHLSTYNRSEYFALGDDWKRVRIRLESRAQSLIPGARVTYQPPYRPGAGLANQSAIKGVVIGNIDAGALIVIKPDGKGKDDITLEGRQINSLLVDDLYLYLAEPKDEPMTPSAANGAAARKTPEAGAAAGTGAAAGSGAAASAAAAGKGSPATGGGANSNSATAATDAKAAADAAAAAAAATAAALQLARPKPKPKPFDPRQRPDVAKPLPPPKVVKEEFDRLTAGREIMVYWVDYREWRPATVVMGFEGAEGMILHVKFEKTGDEQLNFNEPATYNRIRVLPHAQTPDGERKVLASVWYTDLRIADRWNVVSRVWWNKWCSYSGFVSDKPDSKGRIGGPKPGEIDNLTLTLPQSTELKQGLTRLHDYELVPNAVWLHLLDWYGGGPAIERFVIGVGRNLAIELYPMHMQIWIAEPKTGTPILTNARAAVSMQFSLAQLIQKYAPEPVGGRAAPGRVWLRNYGEKHGDTKSGGDSKDGKSDSKSAKSSPTIPPTGGAAGEVPAIDLSASGGRPKTPAAATPSSGVAVVPASPQLPASTASVSGKPRSSLGAIPRPQTETEDQDLMAKAIAASLATPTPTASAKPLASPIPSINSPPTAGDSKSEPASVASPAPAATPAAASSTPGEWKLVPESEYGHLFEMYPVELRPTEVLLEYRNAHFVFPRTALAGGTPAGTGAAAAGAGGSSAARKNWRDFHRDDVIDCKDRNGTWYEAQIIVLEEQRMKMHFIGFTSRDDEWVDRNSETRLAPKNTHTSGPHIPKSAFGIQSIPGKPDVTGAVGLKNLGQSCYMAAALQCLSSVEPLTKYFLDPNHTKYINRSSEDGARGRLADEYAGLLRDMWSEKYRAVAPLAFKQAMGSFRTKFYDSEQQDTHEFLMHLLDGLHEDTNLITVKPGNKEIDTLKSDTEVATAAWSQHTSRNASFVHSLFWCQTKTRVACPECKHTKVQFDPANVLAFPIPDERKKIMPIRFVPFELGLKSKVHKLSVSEFGDLKELKAAMAAATGVAPARLMVRSVRYYRIVAGGGEDGRAAWPDDTPLVSLLADKHTTLQVYEAPPPATPSGGDGKAAAAGAGDLIAIQISQSVKESEWGRRYEARGVPTYLYLKKSKLAQYPNAELQEMARRVVSGFFAQPPSPATLAKLPFTLAICDLNLTTIEVPVLPPTGFHNLSKYAAAGFSFCCLWSYTPQSLEWESVIQPHHPGAELGLSSVIDSNSAGQPRVSLMSCLSAYFKDDTEKEARTCGNCKKKVRFRNRTFLWRLPEVLCVVLRRFSEDSRHKNDAFVDYPIEGLDMKSYIAEAALDSVAAVVPPVMPAGMPTTSDRPLTAAGGRPATAATPQSGDTKLNTTAPTSGGAAASPPPPTRAGPRSFEYDLIAVANHLGTYIGSGHYVASTLNWVNGKWYHFNDSTVTPIASAEVPSKVVTGDAYVLFYKRRK